MPVHSGVDQTTQPNSEASLGIEGVNGNEDDETKEKWRGCCLLRLTILSFLVLYY